MSCIIYQVVAGSPEEVEEIFDAISYCKGASIIRMLHDWIGDKVRILSVDQSHFN